MATKAGWGAIALAAIGIVLTEAAWAADPALDRVAAAMRVNDLKSIRYAGDGVGWTFGQPYRPNEAWPRIRLNSWSRKISYVDKILPLHGRVVPAKELYVAVGDQGRD